MKFAGSVQQIFIRKGAKFQDDICSIFWDTAICRRDFVRSL